LPTVTCLLSPHAGHGRRTPSPLRYRSCSSSWSRATTCSRVSNLNRNHQSTGLQPPTASMSPEASCLKPPESRVKPQASSLRPKSKPRKGQHLPHTPPDVEVDDERTQSIVGGSLRPDPLVWPFVARAPSAAGHRQPPRVQGFGFRVEGVGFGVQGVGFRMYGFRFRKAGFGSGASGIRVTPSAAGNRQPPRV
jgi:hypothetical protein